MKFETLKKNCAQEAYNNYESKLFPAALMLSMSRMIETGKLTKHKETATELRNQAYDMIMRTDIRNVKALADQFPNIVPSWVKSGNYTPELTDNGWELINTSNPY